jgi:hypothetical protein
VTSGPSARAPLEAGVASAQRIGQRSAFARWLALRAPCVATARATSGLAAAAARSASVSASWRFAHPRSIRSTSMRLRGSACLPKCSVVTLAQVGYSLVMLIALAIVGIVAVLLVVFAKVQFGDSGVPRSRENAYWKGGTGPNPPLRYDPEARFKPPSDGG